MIPLFNIKMAIILKKTMRAGRKKEKYLQNENKQINTQQ
jgi:hypothetical protein